MKKQNVRTLSLIICTFTYLLVGAAVFDALESDNEIQQRTLTKKSKSQIVTKYNISNEDFRILEEIISMSVPHRAGHQWKFAGAFYFSTTVITTIGYGHSTPLTVGGKSFCMLYALAGIPLGLVMFQSIGERLNTMVAFTMRTLKRRRDRNADVTHTDLVLIAFSAGIAIMGAGAYAFHKYEGWSYFDALYYCFITLTTIGFGDFVALQHDNALHKSPEYVAFSLIFILFGLTVLSAAMNLLVLRFLTMNTDDERRDQREAIMAAGKYTVDGDIITLNGHTEQAPSTGTCATGSTRPVNGPSDADAQSVCSCSCYQLAYSSKTSATSNIKTSRFLPDSRSPTMPGPSGHATVVAAHVHDDAAHRTSRL